MIVCRSPASRHHPCRCAHDRMLLGVPFLCFRHRHRQRIIAEYCSSSHAGVPMVVCCLVCRSPASRHHPCRCAHDSVPFLCFQTSPMQVLPWKCAHGSAPMALCCFVGCCSVCPWKCSHAGVPMIGCCLVFP